MFLILDFTQSFKLALIYNGKSVNKELKINRNLKTNMFLPIDFYNLKKSIKFIDKSLSKKKQKSFFYIKNVNFNDYLTQD